MDIVTEIQGINSSVQKALKADKLSSRPHAGSGVWASFLLPLAVMLGGLKAADASAIYMSCALYSFNSFVNVLLFLFHIFKCKTINVSKEINISCIIPAIIGALYNKLFMLDINKSLCHTSANALIYFEGVEFFFQNFPKSFTFGEANIVVQGFSLFAFSLFRRLSQILVGVSVNENDMPTVILQLALSWVILFCTVLFNYPSLRQVKYTYIWGFMVLGCIYVSVYWLLNQDLLFWMWNFLTKPERIGIIVLWLICSVAAVVVVQHQISKRKKGNTILRKSFHILATAVFLSGTFLDVSLTYFSSGCVFCLFIILEAFRLLKLPPMYEFLQNGFLAYSDEKDSGILAMTPIYLLVGHALPFWLHPSNEYSSEKQLQLLSGVMSVGIGDTFASVGGKLFGKHFWKGSKKTIEGTVFCILSQVVFIQILVSFQLLQNSTELLVKGLTAIFVTSIVEAKTDQIDNLVLPLIMYILLMI